MKPEVLQQNEISSLNFAPTNTVAEEIPFVNKTTPGAPHFVCKMKPPSLTSSTTPTLIYNSLKVCYKTYLFEVIHTLTMTNITIS
jgi:hypothetical protein